MKTKFGISALGTLAVAALVAGGCANDNATTCDNDKACTDKSGSCCESGKTAKSASCCEGTSKATAVTNTAK